MKVLEVEVEVGDQLEIGGLSVFPLIGRQKVEPTYLTGPEAAEAGLIDVNELDPPEVPSLVITNSGQVPVLLVEGEMLVGGDQNRTMNVTVLCPPGSRTVVPVSCVEAGRWGARRTMSASRRHAPGSLRATKTANLEERSSDTTRRRSAQGLVWGEVERQSMVHNISSDTAALEDIQDEMEVHISSQLDQVKAVQGQIGVVCTVCDDVVGMDLFDRTSSVEAYLRGIIAGHALDASSPLRASDPIGSIERFLAQVNASRREGGEGVGLGEEVLLRGEATGIGLSFQDCLIHLAAFPTPAVVGGD